jgi:hypothetical protein
MGKLSHYRSQVSFHCSVLFAVSINLFADDNVSPPAGDELAELFSVI